MTDTTLAWVTDQLKGHEGFRSKPYRDTVGKLTIGYGRNLDDVGITRAEGGMLLDNDVAKALVEVKNIPCFHLLSEARQACLLNMAFNMGIGGLLKFKNMLAAMDRGDFEAAAHSMLSSLWFTQIGTHRAEGLVKQMRTGVFPDEGVVR